MNRWMKAAAFAVVAIVGWTCGASGVGNALVDAGMLLRDAGKARAQTTCTWQVKTGPTLNFSGQIDQGWEPYAADNGYHVLRRCL